jgi:hypothetical protein
MQASASTPFRKVKEGAAIPEYMIAGRNWQALELNLGTALRVLGNVAL